jgi:hypothetical protein
VQVARPPEQPPEFKQRSLSKQAIASFSALADALEDSPRNQALKTAIAAMVSNRRTAK